MALFGVLSLPMRVLGYLLEELPRAVVSVDRLEGVMAADPAAPAAGTVRALPAGPLGVEVEHLSFAYEPGVPVLDDLSFSIAPGEILAITGATAAGKSTLCLLLAHLVAPTGGSVAIACSASAKRGSPVSS